MEHLSVFLLSVWLLLAPWSALATPGDTTARAQLNPQFLRDVPAINELREEMPFMPQGMKEAVTLFLLSLEREYDQLSAHQKQMLKNEEIFGGRMLTPTRNGARYRLIHHKFSRQFGYIRNQKGWKDGYAFVVNAAPHTKGGQFAYLLDLKTGDMLELKVSTGFTGIGYKLDTGATPLGFFISDLEYNLEGWQSRTVMGENRDMFRRLGVQRWGSMSKWLKKVDTSQERAHIISNQFNLVGQNNGREFVPLEAPRFFHLKDSAAYYVDNLNSGLRQIYIHATNRVDQLGFALSGGCVRVSSLFSFVFKEVIQRQGRVPVFIDAIPFTSPRRNNRSPRFMKQDTEETVSFNKLSVFSYHRIYNDSADAMVQNNLSEIIVKPVINMIMTDDKVSITLKVGASMPLPEPALRDWLKFRHDFAYLKGRKYKNNFDLSGNYYGSSLVRDQGVLKKHSVEEADQLNKERVASASAWLRKQLIASLERFELDFKRFSSQIRIEEVPIGLQDGRQQYISFSLSPERSKITQYLSYLDSLAQHEPDKYNRNELQWISSYLTQPSQEFSNSVGTLIRVDYIDAILAQSYLYAIGELCLRRTLVHDGKIKNMRDDEGFTRIAQPGTDLYYEKIDRLGRQELYTFSVNSTKIGSRLTDKVKTNNERIYGIIMFSEEYMSRYKKSENRLYITTEITLKNTLMDE